MITKFATNIKNYSMMLGWLLIYTLVVLVMLICNLLIFVFAAICWPLNFTSEHATFWLKARSIGIHKQ